MTAHDDIQTVRSGLLPSGALPAFSPNYGALRALDRLAALIEQERQRADKWEQQFGWQVQVTLRAERERDEAQARMEYVSRIAADNPGCAIGPEEWHEVELAETALATVRWVAQLDTKEEAT
jgi:hypothetical protein